MEYGVRDGAEVGAEPGLAHPPSHYEKGRAGRGVDQLGGRAPSVTVSVTATAGNFWHQGRSVTATARSCSARRSGSFSGASLSIAA